MLDSTKAADSFFLLLLFSFFSFPFFLSHVGFFFKTKRYSQVILTDTGVVWFGFFFLHKVLSCSQMHFPVWPREMPRYTIASLLSLLPLCQKRYWSFS